MHIGYLRVQTEASTPSLEARTPRHASTDGVGQAHMGWCSGCRVVWGVAVVFGVVLGCSFQHTPL